MAPALPQPPRANAGPPARPRLGKGKPAPYPPASTGTPTEEAPLRQARADPRAGRADPANGSFDLVPKLGEGWVWRGEEHGCQWGGEEETAEAAAAVAVEGGGSGRSGEAEGGGGSAARVGDDRAKNDR